MKFSAVDQGTYPRLHQYINHQMPQLRTIASILSKLNKYGSLTAAEANTALTWGQDPLVIVNPLNGGQCGVPAANGCFRPTSPNQIELAKFCALEIENLVAGRFDKTSSGRNVLIAGTTLLHELCHWGNKKHGTVYTGGSGEAGVDFENAVYGRNTG